MFNTHAFYIKLASFNLKYKNPDKGTDNLLQQATTELSMGQVYQQQCQAERSSKTAFDIKIDIRMALQHRQFLKQCFICK